MSNRVEHQKLNQTTAELPFGWVFGVQLGLRQTQSLINTNCITLSSSLLDYGEVTRSINQCLCLPKAELNTKNSTKRQLCCRLVEFLVFNSIYQLISLPSDEVYRVGDGGPDHAVVLHMCLQQCPTNLCFIAQWAGHETMTRVRFLMTAYFNFCLAKSLYQKIKKYSLPPPTTNH